MIRHKDLDKHLRILGKKLNLNQISALKVLNQSDTLMVEVLFPVQMKVWCKMDFSAYPFDIQV